jgi:hypothetical protein
MNEAIVHHENVFSLGLARAGLSGYIALPFSNQGAQRLPGIYLFNWFW